MFYAIFAAIDSAWLLGLAALVSACGGIITSILSVRKARHEEQFDCEKRLKEVRKEAEEYADELHRLRMEKAKRREAS